MSLSPGDQVSLRSSGAVYEVGRMLGSGGQGAVYEAWPVDGGGSLALKWYRPDAATRSQAARLERILNAGRPSGNFLWPIEIATHARLGGFGYVMPKRGEGYESLGRLLKQAVPIGLRVTCAAAAGLADAFLRLHSLGLCYADVSLNNVFLNPYDGGVEICDNDNVTIDGASSDVLGTPYYMAPEIVRREAVPDTNTDRYSLAVILFSMLLRHHPLLGARERATEALDAESLQRLLGREPLFVFDPVDDSNRPVPSVHDNLLLIWPMLPQFLRAMFTQAFTVGLHDPRHGRVTESQWRAAFSRLRGLVRHCPVCGTEQFLDPQRPDEPCADPDCRAPMPGPTMLLAKHDTVLEHGLRLSTGDFESGAGSLGTVVADVVRHPTRGGLALRNRSEATWTVVRHGEETDLPPRSAVLIKPTTALRIDGTTVRFRVPD